MVDIFCDKEKVFGIFRLFELFLRLSFIFNSQSFQTFRNTSLGEFLLFQWFFNFWKFFLLVCRR